MNLKDMLRLVSVLSKKTGLTIEKYAEAVISFEEATASERSTKEERISTMDALRALVEEHPEPLDPRDVVVKVGLKQCQADRAFVRHHMAKMRLEYAGAKAA
jgi:hypothetical protein